MTVFVLQENDFDRWYPIGIFDSWQKARSAQSSKEIENNKDWESYCIEEWDVE